jgi:uncharacterized membrane protein YbhN (UPF0104 family)
LPAAVFVTMLAAVRWIQDRLRGHWLDVLGGAVGLTVIIVVFVFVLPRIASYRDVWAAIKDVSWPWLFALAAAAVLNVVTFAPSYMAALPGLPFRSALAVTTASTASTYVAPGGPAVGVGLSFAMLRGWGFRGRAVTIAVTIVTVWNQFMVFGTPIVALAWLTASGGSHPLLQTASFIGLAIFAVIVVGFGVGLSSAALAKRIGDVAARAATRGLALIRRRPVKWSGISFVRFRAEAIGIIRYRWHYLTLATLAGHLSVYLVLLVCLRAFGVTGGEVSLAESFAAWALARVLGSIPITPGGFGIVELGLTGALVAFGGPEAEVVAAVLVYRFLTVAPPLVLGVWFGATWRRYHPQWRQEEASAEAEIGV